MNFRIKLFFSFWILYAFFADPYTDGIHYRFLGPTRSLVEMGTFAIRADKDPAVDAFDYEGRHFSAAAPALAVMAVPYFILAREITRITNFSLPDDVIHRDQFLFRMLVLWGLIAPLAAYGAVAFHRVASSVNSSQSAATWWTIFYSLGTPQLFYASQVYDYAIVSTCVIGALDHLTRSENQLGWGHRAAAGLWLGLSYGLNYSSPVAAVAICAAWGFHWRRRLTLLLPVAAGACLTALPVLAYHTFYFGSPFNTGYTLVAPGDFSSAATPAMGLIPWVMNQDFSLYPERFWGLTMGIRGLFTHAPIALAWPMALLFLPARARRFPAWLLCAPLGASLFFTLNLMMGHGIWQAGTSWGPRYMYPGIVFFVLCLAYTWSSRTAPYWKIIGTVSIFINWVGVQYGNSISLWHHISFFLLSGPTTAFHRWFATHAGPKILEASLSRGLFPGINGHYFALTQPSAMGAYIAVAGVLIAIWFRELRSILAKDAKGLSGTN